MADVVGKRLNVSDVFTIPYEANKLWDVSSSFFEFYGIFSDLATYPTASNIKDYTQSDLLYKSLLANYYPEFYPTNSLSTSSYYQTNNFNSTLTSTDYAVSGALRLGNQATTHKFFPTLTSSYVYTLNIPTSLYSNRILPTTFQMNVSGGLIYDDGEYNLRWSGSTVSSSNGTLISQSSYVGNLFYEQGLGVFTNIPLAETTVFSFTGIPTTMSSIVSVNNVASFDTWLLGSGVINSRPYWYRQSNSTQIIRWNSLDRWVIQNNPYSINFFLPLDTNDPNNEIDWSYPGSPPGVNFFILSGSNRITYASQSLYNTLDYISNVSFKNSYTMYEQNMVCRVKDYEFNTSYNPTLTTGSVGYIFQSSSYWITGSTLPELYTGSYYVYPDNQIKDFATASYFSPYVSTIGFYNDSDQLLAVAKMGQPVPLSNETDITFLVKLDW